ncbi:MAG TPA: DNA polymerase I [Candidatus Onthocola gallistercoris]|uniref:DNA polymerase I n=1 Tax=Candidatus Onthocola gallistercoris TaxID=2840876 RepID=A0A9D1HI35_9FIRM|nr:DNA polymerase I [Candidatus Onthocola gallistercoris]
MKQKAVLIDGHSILNRAFYGVPVLSNSEGLHTNGIYGFLNILFKILDEEKAERLIVAFDLSAPTFRHKMYDAYKGTRKPMPEELREQVPVLKDVLKAMGIMTVSKEGYEADDILGTLSRQCEREGYDVSVISGDRDLLQLATDQICIRIPKTKMSGTEIEDYHAKDVLERYQVTPAQFIDLKALMGDSSDNIPGVPGIGEKTAAKIITTFGSIENAYAHVDEIKPPRASKNLKEHFDLAVMSKKLATIITDCPLDVSIGDATLDHLYSEEAYQIFKRLEFKNILSRFSRDTASNEAWKPAKTVEKEEWDELFGTLKKSPVIGFLAVRETGLEGICISGKDRESSWLPAVGDDWKILEDKLEELYGNGGILSTMDVKSQRHCLGIPEGSRMVDVSLMAYLLNPLKDTYGCDDIARDHLGETIPSRQELFGKKKIAELTEEEKLRLPGWLTCLADVPRRAYPLLREALEKENMWDLYEQIEQPLAFCLCRMENAGIKVEKEALEEYGNRLKSRIETLEKNIWELAGETFNIQSPKQLGVILFEKLHLPFGKKTKTGYSTSASVLEKLRNEDPIIPLILEYRQLTKLKSTYADGLAVFIADDGRIHGTFNQTITATGRISSTDPNLQNIPIRMELGRQIRKVFVPEDGFVFVDADYSQIELRVLAHMSGDEQLIEAYKEEEDIHRITASQVFHVPLDEVTPAQRSNAKAVNFGIVYGISSFGLSQGLSITRKEAENYIRQYFATYPKIKAFLDDLVTSAKETGNAYTLFHRKRPVPELKSANYMQRSFGERVAMNSPIQGTAADIIKIAMIRVDTRLREEKLRSRLVLQVHDELLIEAAEEEVDEVKRILQEEMSQAADLKVPLEIDTNTGHNWYEAK